VDHLDKPIAGVVDMPLVSISLRVHRALRCRRVLVHDIPVLVEGRLLPQRQPVLVDDRREQPAHAIMHQLVHERCAPPVGRRDVDGKPKVGHVLDARRHEVVFVVLDLLAEAFGVDLLDELA
jgi:hypothetical protein